MEFRNARYNLDGSIDCEVNHVDHGWVPTTLKSGDLFEKVAASNPSAWQAPVVNMAEVKALALEAVGLAVSAARRAFVTDLPAQEMIYLAKEAEARAWLAATDPDVADYPFLEAEAGLTAATPTALANLWLQMAGQWRAVAAQIEAVRMIAISAINAATTSAAANAAITNLTSSLTAIANAAG